MLYSKQKKKGSLSRKTEEYLEIAAIATYNSFTTTEFSCKVPGDDYQKFHNWIKIKRQCREVVRLQPSIILAYQRLDNISHSERILSDDFCY